MELFPIVLSSVATFLISAVLLYWMFRIQRHTANELRVSQARYRHLAHNFPKGAVLLFDRDLRYQLVDGRGLAGALLDRTLMEGRTIHEIFPPEFAAQIEPHYRAALAGQEREWEGEYQTHRYVAHAIPVHDGDQVVAGLIIAQDISERHTLEQQVRQMQKMDALGHLAGGVAHDFNNLLSVILGRCERLVTEIRDPKQAKELEAIRQAGERAATLTKHLLAFSRHQPMAPALLDCSEVIGELEPMLARLVTERIQITTRLDRDLPPVLADRMQFEQVLLNLCVNARDAIKDNGQISIETSTVELDDKAGVRLENLPPGRYVRIDVHDTGAGMDASVRSRLFEPFFTTKPVGQGTGLGLAIVFGVVQHCGGRITCESAPGKGSIFTIHLPAVDAAKVAIPATTASVGPVTQSGCETVLLVEDELNVCEMMCDFLKSCGYQVHTAEHAEAAIELLNRQSMRVDVLVSDMVMPGMGGSQLNQLLRERMPGLKTVLISGYTEDDQVGSGNTPAGTVFLQKPFALETLHQRIRALLAA